MPVFKFYYPLQVRYADLDPQWHVNNTQFLAYIEQARLAYVCHLDLWDGKSFLDLGIIIADVHVAYLSPIVLGQKIRVGVRVSRIGNKSLTFDNQVEDEDSGEVLATGEVVAVAYDFHKQKTGPVSEVWREKITAFEGLATS
ncbi:MAG TPA: acyl-CoA thioesterase [Anaerolineae bacterium]|nr:acyl-CoA thioesterase [Anaerolineae bacterium]